MEEKSKRSKNTMRNPPFLMRTLGVPVGRSIARCAPRHTHPLSPRPGTGSVRTDTPQTSAWVSIDTLLPPERCVTSSPLPWGNLPPRRSDPLLPFHGLFMPSCPLEVVPPVRVYGPYHLSVARTCHSAPRLPKAHRPNILFWSGPGWAR